MSHLHSGQMAANESVATYLRPTLALTALGMLLAGCGSVVTPSVETLPVVSESSSSASVRSSVLARKYADGIFSAEGNYESPKGPESVTVSLTLKDGRIIGTTFQGNATTPGSQQFQQLFQDGYRQLVVGKPIDSLALTVVNGSSLTPAGFMDAVRKIREQASQA